MSLLGRIFKTESWYNDQLYDLLHSYKYWVEEICKLYRDRPRYKSHYGRSADEFDRMMNYYESERHKKLMSIKTLLSEMQQKNLKIYEKIEKFVFDIDSLRESYGVKIISTASMKPIFRDYGFLQ